MATKFKYTIWGENHTLREIKSIDRIKPHPISTPPTNLVPYFLSVSFNATYRIPPAQTTDRFGLQAILAIRGTAQSVGVTFTMVERVER